MYANEEKNICFKKIEERKTHSGWVDRKCPETDKFKTQHLKRNQHAKEEDFLKEEHKRNLINQNRRLNAIGKQPHERKKNEWGSSARFGILF